MALVVLAVGAATNVMVAHVLSTTHVGPPSVSAPPSPAGTD